MTSIVYLIRINGEPKYVGSTFEHRFKQRKSEHESYNVAKGLRISDLSFDILEICDDGIRYEREGCHIDQLIIEGYNLLNVSDPREWIVDETRRAKAISKALKGKSFTNSHRKAISEGMIGKPRVFSKSHNEALSKAKKGKPLSESNKKALSEIARKRYRIYYVDEFGNRKFKFGHRL